jgi:type I restriction enzyme R subunit
MAANLVLLEMTPEEKARLQIDAMLAASGWAVQTKDKINLAAARGVAIAELSFKTGEPDHTLFVDGKAIATVEAKPAGETLTSVEEQSAKYVAGVPFGLPAWGSPLPFCYESTGVETFFTNSCHPQSVLLVAASPRCASCASLRLFPVFLAPALRKRSKRA